MSEFVMRSGRVRRRRAWRNKDLHQRAHPLPRPSHSLADMESMPYRCGRLAVSWLAIAIPPWCNIISRISLYLSAPYLEDRVRQVEAYAVNGWTDYRGREDCARTTENSMATYHGHPRCG